MTVGAHSAPRVLIGALALGIALAASSSALAARSAGDRGVAVFVLPANARSSTQVSAAQVVQSLMRRAVLDLNKAYLVTGSPEPNQPIEATVAPLVEQGFRALNDGKGAEAEKLFDKAYDALVRYEGSPNRRLMARTLKGLGVARALVGKLTAAQEAMRASVNVWPNQATPDYGYTLGVRDTFKEVERKVSEDQPGSIDVVTDPEGAEVLVGGQVKGYTPVTVQNVAAGLQYVTVQFDGYQRAGAFVDVKPGEEASQGFALKPRPNADAWATMSKRLVKDSGNKGKMERLMPALKTFLGADGVLVLELTAKGAFVFDGWYFDGTLKRVKETIKQDAFQESIQALLATTVGTSVKDREEEVALDGPPQSSQVATTEDSDFIDPDKIGFDDNAAAGDSVTDKWWFWVIVGGATAGVAAMVVALLTEGEGGKGPTGNITR
jgi:hypothetical protein